MSARCLSYFVAMSYDNMRLQIIKFLIVGGSSAVLDMLLVIVFREKAGFTPVFSVAASQIFVVVYNFLMNKYWSFNSRSQSWRQLARYSLLLIYNYFFGILLMYFFNEVLQYDYRLVRLGSIALLATFNFFFSRYWVYKL